MCSNQEINGVKRLLLCGDIECSVHTREGSIPEERKETGIETSKTNSRTS